MTSFKVGLTYAARSPGDYNCIFTFPVLARSAKSITIRAHGKEVRRGITARDGVETVAPLGRYSMSPILCADKIAATVSA